MRFVVNFLRCSSPSASPVPQQTSQVLKITGCCPAYEVRRLLIGGLPRAPASPPIIRPYAWESSFVSPWTPIASVRISWKFRPFSKEKIFINQSRLFDRGWNGRRACHDLMMVIWIGKSNKQKPQSDRTIWLGLFYWEVNNHFSSLHDNAKTPTELTAASSLMPIQSTSKLHYRCLRNAQRRKLGHSFISAITFRWFVVRVCDGFARWDFLSPLYVGFRPSKI